MSGYKVKGKKACPICKDDTQSLYLSHSRKYVYMTHRRYLNKFHPFRKKKVPFNGKNEVIEQVKDIQNVFGKGVKTKVFDGLYKKK